MAEISNALPPPHKCDNCNSKRVRFKRNTRRNRAMFLCLDCRASVLCHKGTNIPLGYMATSHTRYLRAKAHDAFDPMWKTQLISRDEAYAWLARQLGVEPEDAHIGRLTNAQLDKLARKSGRQLRKLIARDKKRKAIQNATDRRQRAATRRRKSGGKWKPTGE